MMIILTMVCSEKGMVQNGVNRVKKQFSGCCTKNVCHARWGVRMFPEHFFPRTAVLRQRADVLGIDCTPQPVQPYLVRWYLVRSSTRMR